MKDENNSLKEEKNKNSIEINKLKKENENLKNGNKILNENPIKENKEISKSTNCKNCKSKLVWQGYGSNNSCSSKCDCDFKFKLQFKYYCKSCNKKYCLNCVYPENADYCGCGKAIKREQLNNNICNICRKSLINILARRCKSCDYDICDSCHKEHLMI